MARDPELGWRVFSHGGKRPTDRAATEWLTCAATELGAGEILLTSIDRDGTGQGFDLELLHAVATLPVPVIASGGAGTLAHLAEVLDQGHASAVLAASIFHFGTFTIPQAKAYLAGRGVPVRR